MGWAEQRRLQRLYAYRRSFFLDSARLSLWTFKFKGLPDVFWILCTWTLLSRTSRKWIGAWLCDTGCRFSTFDDDNGKCWALGMATFFGHCLCECLARQNTASANWWGVLPSTGVLRIHCMFGYCCHSLRPKQPWASKPCLQRKTGHAACPICWNLEPTGYFHAALRPRFLCKKCLERIVVPITWQCHWLSARHCNAAPGFSSPRDGSKWNHGGRPRGRKPVSNLPLLSMRDHHDCSHTSPCLGKWKSWGRESWLTFSAKSL